MASRSAPSRTFLVLSKKMGHDYLGSFDDAGYLRLFLKKLK